MFLLKDYKVRFYDSYYHKLGKVEMVSALNKTQAEVFSRMICEVLQKGNNDWTDNVHWEFVK